MKALLDTLHAAGVTLRADGGELVIRAPKGVLTPALHEQIAAHKAALLALLAPPAADMPPLLAPTARKDAPDGPLAAAVGRMDIAESSPLARPNNSARIPANSCQLPECSPPVEQQNNGALPLPGPCPTLTDVVPADALPLWLYDLLYPPGPGESPAIPPPAELTAAQVAAAILAARVIRPVPIDAGPTGGSARPVGSAPEATPHRRPPRPRPAERDRAAMARILDRGAELGYPSLAYRPGESIAAGADGWRRFVAQAPPDRLGEAARAFADIGAEVGTCLP